MDRRHPLIVLAAVLSLSCNAVFDLRETRGPDSDGDGLSDERDNCALADNPEQTNADGDTLGDACDPCDGPQTGQDSDDDGLDDGCDACPEGSNHDEDGDGSLDGCDLCPGLADVGADADGDGVGDACDASPGIANQRVFFDGFGPPRADWETWFEQWIADGDELRAVGVGADGTWNRAGEVSATGWWMEVALVTPTTMTDGDRIGINARDQDGSVVMSCYAELDIVGGVWRPLGELSSSVTLPAISRFRVRYLGGATAECSIHGQLVPIDVDAAPNSTFLPSLLAHTGAPFLWVDVVAGPSL